MNYILDTNGYIYDVSFGALIECDLGTCIEYTGDVPTGYDDLNEWADNACINAYKIQSGNLVLDTNKQAELEALWEIQEEENANATHKWVNEQLNKESDVVLDELSSNIDGSSLCVLKDSGAYEIPNIIIRTATDIIGSLALKVSSKNLLANKAVTSTISGVTITINEDKSITLNGTASAAIELTLDGTSTNTDMLFLIANSTDYTISGLANGVTLNLYKYDGTNRTLIDNCTNETINLTTGGIVTQTTLSIANGSVFSSVTISPMIEVGDEASDYEECEENTLLTLDLDTNTFATTDYIEIDYSSAILKKNDNTEVYLNMNDLLYGFNPITTIMLNKEVTTSITYFTGKTIGTQKSQIETLDNEIASTVVSVNNYFQELNGKFDDYTPISRTAYIEQSVNTLQTDTYTKTEINTKLIDGSVQKVQTTSATFDEDGMHYAKTGTDTETTINQDGIRVDDVSGSTGDTLLFAGYDTNLGETVVRAKNLQAEQYLIIAGTGRLEEYDGGIGGFIV